MCLLRAWKTAVCQDISWLNYAQEWAPIQQNQTGKLFVLQWFPPASCCKHLLSLFFSLCFAWNSWNSSAPIWFGERRLLPRWADSVWWKVQWWGWLRSSCTWQQRWTERGSGVGENRAKLLIQQKQGLRADQSEHMHRTRNAQVSRYKVNK